MAFNRAGIEKAWNSVTSKAAELRQGAAGMIEGAKNSKAGGMVSDSAAAIHGIGLHTLGGAAMGGTINAAAYANDGHAFTSADSGASAFLSGAGYGAAAGMGLGMMHAKKYAAYNAAKRTNSKLKQGTMTKAMQERADVNTAHVKKMMDARDRQAFDMQNRLDMASDGGPIDVLSPSASRHPNIAPTGSFGNLPGRKPPTRQDVAEARGLYDSQADARMKNAQRRNKPGPTAPDPAPSGIDPAVRQAWIDKHAVRQARGGKIGKQIAMNFNERPLPKGQGKLF